MIERHDRRAWAYGAAAVGGALAIMLLPVLILSPGHHHGPIVINPTRVVLFTLAAILAVGWGGWFARLSFLHFDEFLQEGSKFAWYWGGQLGILVSAPLYVFIGTGGLHWLDPSRPVGHELGLAFVLGYCVLLFPQALCFLGVYAWWKRTKR
jgi:hypothetical protein